MAYGNATIFEINSGGSDTANGGGFDPAATMATDLAATAGNTASPVVTSASFNFTSSDVGAYLFIQSGTNWVPGWYQIVSTASNAATLAAPVGSVLYNNTTSPVSSAAGVASTASPTGGTWSVDYSRSTAPRISYADMVIGATTTQFTSAGNPVGPNIVGNFIAVTSGTGFTVQRVEVVSVSGTTATCDRSLGTTASTGGHGGLGGALASPGQMGAMWAINTNMSAFVAAGTYNMVNSANVSGGYINSNIQGFFSGYTSNRQIWNTDTRPIIQSNANSITLITTNVNTWIISNIDFENGNFNTGVQAISIPGSDGTVCNCKIAGMATGITGSATLTAYVNVLLLNLTGTANPAINVSGNGFWFYGCSAINCAGGGFAATIYSTASNCLVAGTGGVGSKRAYSNIGACYNCVAYMNATLCTGFYFTGGPCVNCIAEGCTTAGFDSSQAQLPTLINCAGYNNLVNYSVNYTTPNRVANFTALSASPFTAAGTTTAADFTLTAASGLRGAAIPSPFPGTVSGSYNDLGPIRHQDVSSGPTAAAIAAAVWGDLTASADFGTAGSIGLLLKTNVNAQLSTLSTYAGADTSGTTTLLTRLTSTRAGYLDNLNVGGFVASQAALGGLSAQVGSPIQTTSSVIVGGYTTGQDPATLVLDAAQSAHNTAGTIGAAIGTAAAGGGGGGGDTPGTTTLLSRLTATRAGNLDNLDAAVSTRSTYAGGDTAGTTTLLGRLTPTRATGLDNLDAAVSSRSTYAGGPVASVSAPVTVGSNTDKGGYSLATAPPTAAAIATAVWTDATATSDFSGVGSIGLQLATNLDAKVSTRSTYAGGAVASVTGAVTVNLGQTLSAARALDTIADTALTLNDALHCGIAGAAGRESVTGLSYLVQTPSTGTTLRTFTLDNSTAPTSRS
jgi:hypothetical protein